ncbi:MAG: response regulator transcription factor [Kiritimatiellae bacterium]|nr:response regulator transcription factor [Kiritimatiellia bacterium]
MKIKILLADDHSVVRMGLKALFGCEPDFSVVGEAEDGLQAVELARALAPDVVVMDLMMPKLNGVKAIRRIKAMGIEARVLVLTSYGTTDEVAQAVAAGATGVIVKDATNDEIIDAIRRVAHGDSVFSPEIANTINCPSAPNSLTTRQMEILLMVAKGLSNPEIARMFGISVDGVKNHLNAIFSKIDASNRTEAVAIALRKHLLKI